MKMLSACLLLLPFISCTQVQDTKNDAVIEQKIEALLSRMTLEEKIGQMNQISSYGNIEDMSGLIKKGEVGSILNEVEPVRKILKSFFLNLLFLQEKQVKNIIRLPL